MMRHARLGWLAALGTAVALAVPTVAAANEATKWNEIAVNTVNTQPPITSAPPAGAVFVAMVQALSTVPSTLSTGMGSRI